jgi:hypothetical protein
LTKIHQKHPRVKLFAFNIIPRLLISDDPHTEKYKQPMAEWSMLQETTSLFENPGDMDRLRVLETSIPSDIRDRYRKLYSDNHQMNRRLVSLAHAGVLSGLVLGQDDSAFFGLGNMERQRMQNETGNKPEMSKKVFITRGTDEVALSLLVPATHEATAKRHKAYVHYTEAHTADTILPYMPRPLARTVEEKLAIGAADATDSLAEADYILVVHAGDSQSRAQLLAVEADRVRTWIETGHNVVLVDLATDWTESQSLLPYLRRNGTRIHQLLGYSGWNTASNSVGTAIAQAAMSLLGRDSGDNATALYRDTARVGFLSERILDDWYYQKIYRHILNEELLKQKIDPYDLKQDRQVVTARINHHIFNASLQYLQWEWRDAIFPLRSGNVGSYAVDRWEIKSGLPWDRTFEIFVGAKIVPARIIEW